MVTFEEFLHDVKPHTYNIQYKGYKYKPNNNYVNIIMCQVAIYLAHSPQIIHTPITLHQRLLTNFQHTIRFIPTRYFHL